MLLQVNKLIDSFESDILSNSTYYNSSIGCIEYIRFFKSDKSYKIQTIHLPKCYLCNSNNNFNVFFTDDVIRELCIVCNCSDVKIDFTLWNNYYERWIY